MGIYLYGLKQLKKPQRVTRNDGAVAVVTHFLNFRHKLWFHRDDVDARRIAGELEYRYGENWKGFILYGDRVIAWDGPPHWCDGGDFPRRCEVWGVTLDESGEKELKTASRARMPSMRVQDGTVSRLMERVLTVQDSERYLINSTTCYATWRHDLGVGTAEFGGGARIIHLAADNDQHLMNLFDNYCKLAQDWLEETTVIPPKPPQPQPKPVAPPVVVPQPTYEELLQAAGWI